MGRETSLVLAIEPDTTRAESLRQIVRDRLGIELVLVSSPYAANVAMNRQLPELLLFSSSLSDRNQNKVIAHYRALTDGVDPQTLIIPLLRDAADEAKSTSRFSFKWKRQSQGTSANVFLDTIATYLKRAGSQPGRTPNAGPVLPTVPPPAPDTSILASGTGPTASAEAPPLQAEETPPDEQAVTESPAVNAAPAGARLDESVVPQVPPVESAPASAAATAVALGPVEVPADEPDVALVEDGDEVVLDVAPAPESEASSPAVSAPVNVTDVSTPPVQQPIEHAAAAASAEVADAADDDSFVADAPAHTVIASVTALPEPATEAASLAKAPAEGELVADRDPAGGLEPPVETAPPAWSAYEPSMTEADAGVEVEALGQSPPAPPTSLDELFDEVHIDPGTLAIEAATEDEEEQGVDLSALIEAPPAQMRESGVDPEVHAAEIALIRLEAEQKLAGELDRLRVEAVQQREAELARLHAEAEALRHSTVAQAREAAEAEARDAWAGELARVRAEAEQTVAEALNRVRSEAEQTLTSEVLRARAEAEQERQAQLAQVQAELERARAEAEQVRQAQLAHFQEAEERVDSVTRQVREAEAEAAQERLAQIARLQAEAEALRLDAVARARAEVEAEARETLAAELARVREEAAHSVDEALSRVRQEAASTVTSEVSRAREQAELERSEELARIEAALDARVSAAARAAREAAEAEASKTFTTELERARAQAEQTFASEVERLRSEAQRAAEERDRVLAHVTSEREADRVRAVAEAEALRQHALEEARQAAETAAQRAMEREVERVTMEAEARVREEVERLRSEAERARSERSEAALEAEKVREAAREVEREIARVRAASEARLQEELEQVRREAERAREAERKTARDEAERLRQAAAQDARAVAEAALKAELERVRAESESRLAAELEQLRSETERQRSSELAELRAQLSQVRDAAAEQAQKAASDAIAAEVAKANRERAAASVAPPPPPPLSGMGIPASGGVAPGVRPPAPASPVQQSGQRSSSTFSVPATHPAGSRTQDAPRLPPRTSAPAPRTREREATWAPPPPPPPPAGRRWHVPAIGAVVLIAAATASYNWLPVRVQWNAPTTAAAPAAAEAVAAPAAPAPPRLGGPISIDSLPTGATVTVDGRARGTAPLTLTDLTAGTHTVLFEANGVTVSRAIRVRPEQPLTVSQEMTAGFLSVFSRVPVDIVVDGRRIGTTEDGQLLVGPGTHKVRLENERFNFRSELSLDIKPGEVTAHTVILPMGTVVLTTDAGSEVWIEGERIGVAPLGPVAVPIGTREVLVKLDGNEARQSVEVVYGRQSALTMSAAATTPPETSSPGPAALAPLVAPTAGAQAEPR